MPFPTVRRHQLTPLAVLFALGCIFPTDGKVETIDLFDGFSKGWRDSWKEQKLFPFQKRTVYSVEDDPSGSPVLKGESHDANLGLIRPFEGDLPESAILRWRWKIAAPIPKNTRERERAGDDFAARVFVVYETSLIPTRTRAINYVWSATEPSESVFPNAYTKHVGMVVLRCAAEEPLGWMTEERDLFEDYRRFFGRDPEELSAIALMVDTDNTSESATAWFADLELEICDPEGSDQ